MKFIIANWKMNPRSVDDVKKYFSVFNRKKRIDTGITTVFCPPNLFVESVVKYTKKNRKVHVGLQNMFWEEEGSYTGETGTSMAKNSGARFVIVGHSERRALGETNQEIARKVKAGLESGFHVVLCIGESKRDNSGAYLRFIEKQLTESLAGVKRTEVKKLVIAYEPVWAIGTGKKPPAVHDIAQTTMYIKKLLYKMYGKKIAEATSILYGGSTDAENVKNIIYEGSVDGVLVGRSSLNPHEFSEMITAVAKK